MSLRVSTAKTNHVKVYGENEPKVKESGCARAVREFCKDTTLHGFKYLASENYYDR
ncbi:jg7123, partial [Pararge aegeria aegeria]